MGQAAHLVFCVTKLFQDATHIALAFAIFLSCYGSHLTRGSWHQLNQGNETETQERRTTNENLYFVTQRRRSSVFLDDIGRDITRWTYTASTEILSLDLSSQLTGPVRSGFIKQVNNVKVVWVFLLQFVELFPKEDVLLRDV
jgi:hypothetical protein